MRRGLQGSGDTRWASCATQKPPCLRLRCSLLHPTPNITCQCVLGQGLSLSLTPRMVGAIHSRAGLAASVRMLAPLVVLFIYISIWYYFSYTSIYLSVSLEATVASLNLLPLCRIAVFSIKPTFLSWKVSGMLCLSMGEGRDINVKAGAPASLR